MSYSTIVNNLLYVAVLCLSLGMTAGGWFTRTAFLMVGVALVLKKLMRQESFTVSVSQLALAFGLIAYLLALALAANDPSVGVNELIVVGANMFLALTYARAACSVNAGIYQVSDMWCKMFLITALIALIELAFDFHLPMSKDEASAQLTYAGVTLERQFASVTFGNLNSYNTVVIFSGPFIVARVLLAKSSVISWAGFCLLVLILIANGSRAGAIFAAVLTLVLAFSLANSRLGVCVFVVVLGGLGYVLVASGFGTVSLLRMLSEGVNDPGRVQIISASMKALEKSFLLGIGPGNLQPILGSRYGLDLTAPHNVFVEVSSQYGLPLAVAFFGIFARSVVRGFCAGGPVARSVCFLFGSAFVIGGIVDSGHLDSLVFWTFYVSAIVASESLRMSRAVAQRTARNQEKLHRFEKDTYETGEKNAR
jgi:teichuronic acid biosynthesis protein TuaE